MRKLLLFILLLALPCFIAGVNAQMMKDGKKKMKHDGTEMRIAKDSLPQQAMDFLSRYFPSDQAVKIKTNWDRSEYDVYLKSGIRIEFTRNGIWKEIKCRKGVPASAMAMLPGNTVSFLQRNYPKSMIVELERKSFGYEIELAGRPMKELYFDKDGNNISHSLKETLEDEQEQNWNQEMLDQ